MLIRAMKVARSFYYDLVLAPRGYGKPVPTATWDLQYEHGDWDYLYSLDEMGHYMVVAGYVHQSRKSRSDLPSILDVGCGGGRLLELLSRFGFSSYRGLDLSAEAIKQAESLGVARAEFEAADFEQWDTDKRFDIIIFNESLCYASRPVDVLLRYADRLKGDGFMIVSLCRYGNHGLIWQNLYKHFAVIDSTTVENKKQQVWDVRVVRPKVA